MKEQLIKVPYIQQFKYVCDISNLSSLLLDNMEIWGLKRDVISKKLDFDIVMDSGEKYIIPRCKPEYDEFLLKAERVYLVDETFESTLGKETFVSKLK